MNAKPGEIHLVDLGMIGKVRPAVVVSRYDDNAPRAISICVPLTSQYRGSAYEVMLGKLRFLDKESWANVQGIAGLGNDKLLRRLGQVTPEQLSRIKVALRYTFEL
ncbi:MAG: type II toxin-antitoxin system PemK/MazF family toxin [Methylacidiphilales bacterium]|nr:type II toxin-antitoxin system PemK/MazF family toxin [Candidatus Methylacidiphilales bacterium]